MDLTKQGGGIFAPTSIPELLKWIDVEMTLWSPLRNVSDADLQNAANAYNHAHNAANKALNIKERGQDPSQEIAHARSNIENAISRLPHSDSSIGRKVAWFRESVEGDDRATGLYAMVRLSQNKRISFQADSLATWRALMVGMIERHDLLALIPESSLATTTEGFEDLRSTAASLISGTQQTLAKLENESYDALSKLEDAAVNEKARFVQAQEDREAQFEKLKSDHDEQMAQIRKTFTEDIALKAPAEYWNDKHSRHYWLAWLTGLISFGAIGSCAAGLAWFVHDLLLKLPPNTAPELWRIGTIATFGLFSVWAARLFVRMFLSHLHLSGDAGERIVMIKTYLSLLEGDRLASKEDRQLILQAIFRPASDGIVKDEAVPVSMFEALTRSK